MSTLQFWFHHGGVSVPDLDEAIAWYRDVLGFELERRSPIPSVPCEMAMLRNGDLRMELFEAPAAKPPTEDRTYPDVDLLSHGNKHVSFVVEDVDPVAEQLKQRGADIVWVKKFPNGRANIFIRDRFGNLIEFVQGPRPEGAPSQL
jgi:methylmalonyl-CoA/ethylmalonyl-CoA epimerase